MAGASGNGDDRRKGRVFFPYRHTDHGRGRPSAAPAVEERKAGERRAPRAGDGAWRRPEEAGEEGLHLCSGDEAGAEHERWG